MITSLELADINRSLADMHHRLSELERKARPTPEPRKPREFWLHMMDGHYVVCDKENCRVTAGISDIRVREVLPE